MSSRDEIKVMRPGLLDSKGEAKLPSSKLKDFVTREELIKGAAQAAHAVGAKMYDQMAGETAALLEDMDRQMRQMIREEFYRRSLRGRWATFKAWLRETAFGAVLMELGILGLPKPLQIVADVEATEALDPSSPAASIEEERPLLYREFRHYDPGCKQWMEAGGVAIVPDPVRRMSTPEAARLAAATTEILRRAVVQLMGENAPELEEGVLIIGLDDELLDDARKLVRASGGGL